MKFAKFLTAAAMVSLAAAPIAAQAKDAASARVASKSDGEAIAGFSPIVLILALAAVVAVVVLVADDNNKPASP